MYWQPLQLGLLNAQPSANAILNLAVLTGRRATVRAAQEVVNAPQDGILGAVTLSAINDFGPRFFVPRLAMRMELYFASCVAAQPNQVKFLRAWLGRCHRLIKLVT
jgi:lysozyme family protein